jgi:hypothetical protein
MNSSFSVCIKGVQTDILMQKICLGKGGRKFLDTGLMEKIGFGQLVLDAEGFLKKVIKHLFENFRLHHCSSLKLCPQISTKSGLTSSSDYHLYLSRQFQVFAAKDRPNVSQPDDKSSIISVER